MTLLCRILTVAGLVAAIASSLRVYPHQLAYFNELSGGPESGYRHLLASNLDWEQDLLSVVEWMESHGINPSEANVVTIDPQLVNVLIPRGPDGVGPIKWDIVSCNKVAEPGSPWRTRLSDPTTRRIGYAYWAFPVSRSP